MTDLQSYRTPECREICIGPLDFLAVSVGGGIDPAPWAGEDNNDFFTNEDQ